MEIFLEISEWDYSGQLVKFREQGEFVSLLPSDEGGMILTYKHPEYGLHEVEVKGHQTVTIND